MMIVTTILFLLFSYVRLQQSDHQKDSFTMNIYRKFKNLPFNGSDTIPGDFSLSETDEASKRGLDTINK